MCSRWADRSSVSSSTANDRVERFIAQLTRDVDVDYTPIVDAGDASRRADLIVLGTITTASEGLEISGREGVWNHMLNLDVRVERVLSGMADLVGKDVHVEFFVSSVTGGNELEAALPAVRAVFVLDDITRWIPFPDAIIKYPDGLVEGEAIFTPFVDGVVFDNPGGARHLYLSEEEAAKSWTQGGSFDDLIATIQAAADSH